MHWLKPLAEPQPDDQRPVKGALSAPPEAAAKPPLRGRWAAGTSKWSTN